MCVSLVNVDSLITVTNLIKYIRSMTKNAPKNVMLAYRVCKLFFLVRAPKFVCRFQLWTKSNSEKSKLNYDLVGTSFIPKMSVRPFVLLFRICQVLFETFC